MTPLRLYLRDRRHLALALIALALLMRMLIPVGFMPEVSAGKITIALCTGHGPAVIEMAMPSSGHHDSDKSAKPDMPCPFGSVSSQGLTGADPILLAGVRAAHRRCALSAAAAARPAPHHLTLCPTRAS
jgi:hypothetical protein